jgi:predicted Zn-dependent peptidase
MSAADVVIAERPGTGTPRPYDFPAVERTTLANGLRVGVAAMPGRELVSASLVIRHGAGDEPDALGGASVLLARALTEGTQRHDAIALVEATERLGASIHAEAGWDATSVSVDVPAARLAQALELLAEVAREPTFPEAEVDRLRDERLNDLLQARADPRRRAEEAFVATIYDGASPYRRPAGGARETVEGLMAAQLRQVYRAAVDPARTALIVGGDLDAQEVIGHAERLFGDWRADGAATIGRPADAGAVTSRFVKVVDRPGAVQTEIRIGHTGVPRKSPDFHALSVLGAILGGLFNSRLNMKLREEKGYTYGASAGFDMRRARGPFAARAAVNTEVTVAAVTDAVAELDRIREAPVTPAELTAARDFLIGVFPLRFETPGPVVGSLGSLFVHDLPDDELNRYRAAIEAVTADDVQRVARERIRPAESAILLVGDLSAFREELEAAAFGPLVVERDEGPTTEGPMVSGEEEAGPVDAGEPGPTGRAEDAEVTGIEDPTKSDAPTDVPDSERA